MQDRPMSAKTTFYQQNGSGRDTYITFNNGGFCAANTKKNNFDRGIIYLHF